MKQFISQLISSPSQALQLISSPQPSNLQSRRQSQHHSLNLYTCQSSQKQESASHQKVEQQENRIRPAQTYQQQKGSHIPNVSDVLQSTPIKRNSQQKLCNTDQDRQNGENVIMKTIMQENQLLKKKLSLMAQALESQRIHAHQNIFDSHREGSELTSALNLDASYSNCVTGNHTPLKEEIVEVKPLNIQSSQKFNSKINSTFNSNKKQIYPQEDHNPAFNLANGNGSQFQSLRGSFQQAHQQKQSILLNLDDCFKRKFESQISKQHFQKFLHHCQQSVSSHNSSSMFSDNEKLIRMEGASKIRDKENFNIESKTSIQSQSSLPDEGSSSQGDNRKFKIKFSSVKRNIADQSRGSEEVQIISTSLHQRQKSSNIEFGVKTQQQISKIKLGHQKVNSNLIEASNKNENPQYYEHDLGDASSSSAFNQPQLKVFSQLREADFLEQDQDDDFISSLNRQCDFQYTQGFLLSQAQSPKVTVASTGFNQDLVKVNLKLSKNERNRYMPLKVLRNHSVIKNYEDFIKIRRDLDSANTTYSKLQSEVSPIKRQIKKEDTYGYADKIHAHNANDSRNQDFDLSCSFKSSTESVISRDDPTCLTSTNQIIKGIDANNKYLIQRDESANLKSPFQKFLQKSEVISKLNDRQEDRLKAAPITSVYESPKKIKGFRGEFEYPLNQIIQDTTQNFALSQLSFTQDISQLNFQELQAITTSSPIKELESCINYQEEIINDEEDDISYEDEEVKNEYQQEGQVQQSGQSAQRVVSPSRERNFIKDKLINAHSQYKEINSRGQIKDEVLSRVSSRQSLVEDEKFRGQKQVIRSFSPILSLSAQKGSSKFQGIQISRQSAQRSSFAHFRTEQKCDELNIMQQERLKERMIMNEEYIRDQQQSEHQSLKYLSPQQRKHAQSAIKERKMIESSAGSNPEIRSERETEHLKNQRDSALSFQKQTVETEVDNRFGREAQVNNWVIDQEEKIKNIIQLNQQLIGKQLSLFRRSFEREMQVENGLIPSQKLKDTQRIPKIELAKQDDQQPMDISCKSSILPIPQENDQAASVTMDQFYSARQSPKEQNKTLLKSLNSKLDLTQRSPIQNNRTIDEIQGYSAQLDEYKTANEVIVVSADQEKMETSLRNPIEDTLQLDYEFQHQQVNLCESMIQPSHNQQALNQSTLSQTSLQGSKLNSSGFHLRQSFNQNNRLTKLAEGLRAQQMALLMQSNILEKSTEREGSQERSNWKSIVNEIQSSQRYQHRDETIQQLEDEFQSPGGSRKSKYTQRQVSCENVEGDVVTTPSPRIVGISIHGAELDEDLLPYQEFREENQKAQYEDHRQNLQEELFLQDIFESSNNNNLMTFRPDQNSNHIFEVSRNVQHALQETLKEIQSIQSSPEHVVSVLYSAQENIFNQDLQRNQYQTSQGIEVYQSTPKKKATDRVQKKMMTNSNDLKQSFNDYTHYKLEYEINKNASPQSNLNKSLQSKSERELLSREIMASPHKQSSAHQSPMQRKQTPEEVQEQLYHAILEENRSKRLTSQQKLRKNNSSIREQPSEEDRESAFAPKCSSLIQKSNSQVSQVSQLSMRNFIMKESEIFNAQTKSAEITENQTPSNSHSDIINNQRTLDFYNNDELDIEMPLQVVPSPSAQPDPSWKYKRVDRSQKVIKLKESQMISFRNSKASELIQSYQISSKNSAKNQRKDLQIGLMDTKQSFSSAFSPVAVVSSLDGKYLNSQSKIQSQANLNKLIQFSALTFREEGREDESLVNIVDTSIQMTQASDKAKKRGLQQSQNQTSSRDANASSSFYTPLKTLQVSRTDRYSFKLESDSSRSHVKLEQTRHNFKQERLSDQGDAVQDKVKVQRFNLKQRIKECSTGSKGVQDSQVKEGAKQVTPLKKLPTEKSSQSKEQKQAFNSARSIIRGVCQSIQDQKKSQSSMNLEEAKEDSKNIVQRNLKKRMPKQKHYLQAQSNHQMIGDQFKPILSHKHLPQDQLQAKNPFGMSGVVNSHHYPSPHYQHGHPQHSNKDESFKITLFKTELLETSNTNSQNSSDIEICKQQNNQGPAQPIPYPQLNNSYFRSTKLDSSRLEEKRVSGFVYHPQFDKSQQSSGGQNQSHSFAKYLQCNQNAADSRRASGQSNTSSKVSLNRSIDQKKSSVGIEVKGTYSSSNRQFDSVRNQTPKEKSKQQGLSTSSVTLLNTSSISSHNKGVSSTKKKQEVTSTRAQVRKEAALIRKNLNDNHNGSSYSSLLMDHNAKCLNHLGFESREQSVADKEYFNISSKESSTLSGARRSQQTRALF